ncbi:MAG: replication-relaxation family protein [Firmicutes bacterium]|nr:replication-relaxation family protein [Bacillota bacterium]
MSKKKRNRRTPVRTPVRDRPLAIEDRRFPDSMNFKGKEDYRNQAESLPITPKDGPARLGRNQLIELIDRLSERDFEILLTLKQAKYLLTGQVQRLHVPVTAKPATAMQNAVNNMKKLKKHGLVKTFDRRIGGVRAGSASFVWCLTEAGQRLLDLKDGAENLQRSHRYLEPAYAHLKHTLAIAECYVQLVEISRRHKDILLQNIEWEPDCWRPYRQDGHMMQLKPDLSVVTRNAGYIDRWFIEIDMNTEAIPVIIEKCKRYHQYLSTGIEQRRNEGVFPIPVWIVVNDDRKQKIIDAIKESFKKGPHMFVVIKAEEFESLIKNGANQEQMY